MAKPSPKPSYDVVVVFSQNRRFAFSIDDKDKAQERYAQIKREGLEVFDPDSQTLLYYPAHIIDHMELRIITA